MDKNICTYNSYRRSGNKTINISCRNCKYGNSTIFDKKCRQNIFKILQIENTVNRLILNHAYVKVFQGKELQILKDLNNFLENIKAYTHLKLPSKSRKECTNCNKTRFNNIKKKIKKKKKHHFESF